VTGRHVFDVEPGGQPNLAAEAGWRRAG
jgi:hypothetical protein